MEKKKLFISQPMKGKTEEEIRKERENAVISAKEILKEEVAVIDSYIAEDPPKNWTIVNKKDTIFKYIFWERLDSLPIPESCFHFVWCQIA